MEQATGLMEGERRRFKRFKPKEGTLVAVFDTLAQIVDISQAGLAFICVDWDDLDYEQSSLDILCEGSEWLRDIPFEVVSRNVLENRFTTDQLRMQRCGIRFGELSGEQKAQLDHLLTNYIQGQA